MAKPKGTFSNIGNSQYGGITMYGVDELFDKIDRLGVKAVDIARAALAAGAAPVEEDMRHVVSKGQHYRSGDLLKLLGTSIKVSGTKVSGTVGFPTPEGLPALYLDVGTARGEKPTFFVYYAYRNNAEKVSDAMRSAVHKGIEDAMK